MKKSHYKSGILLYIPLLLISFALSAQQEVTKEFHKEFIAGAGSTLEISNKYGDIVVTSWDKDQVVIDVKVTVEMPDREKAEKLISYIDVQFSENGNLLSAKTIIDDKFNFSGWGSGSRRFSIDYTIKMPVALDLTLSNRYGDTDIDELNGLINLDIKYGNLKAGKLTRGNVKPLSKLSLAYGKATIDETGWLDMIVRYAGGVEITKSQALLIDSKYSKLSLGTTSSVVAESRYDNIRIESINNLILENGYTEVNIGSLSKQLEYNGSYGSFTVDRIPVGFESIDVETRYMGVRLGIDSGSSYKLDAKVSYGGLKYNENDFNSQRRIISNNSNEVAGIVGRELSPASGVKVVASYGTVKLY